MGDSEVFEEDIKEIKMNKNGKKFFKDWILLKEKLHNDKRVFLVSEGDVWWCAVGENVGVEICGKGKTFVRPVLVVRKFGKFSFLGVPLTSQNHKGSWYVSFRFKNKKQIAVLSQIETISVLRLYNKMGTVPNSDLDLVKEGIYKLIKNTP